MENIKDALGALLLALLIYLAVQAINLVHITQESLFRITAKVETTTQNIANASNALARSSVAQEKLLTDPDNQAAVDRLIKKVDVVAKAVDNAERTTAQAEKVLAQVNKDILPATTLAINSGRTTLDETTLLVQDARKNLNKLSDLAGKDFEALQALIENPNIRVLLGNLADTSLAVKSTAQNVDATSAEIKEALPELIANLQQISTNLTHSSDHVERGTNAIANFLVKLQHPETKKQKLFRYLIQAAVIAAPYAIRR